MNKRYYLLPENQDHAKAVKEGFQWLLKNTRSNYMNECLIIIPSLNSLKYESDTAYKGIESVIPGISSKLIKNKSVTTNGITVKLMTESTRITYTRASVLAIFPAKIMLKIIDNHFTENDIFLVGWIYEDIQEWIETWKALDFSSKYEVKHKPQRLNPIIIEALKSLTMHINMSTGITDSNDKCRAVELFRILQRESIDYDPKIIKAWLKVEKKWKEDFADDVMQIATKIKARKRVDGCKGDYWATNIFEKWKQRSEENKQI